jgi:hypothetical protein
MRHEFQCRPADESYRDGSNTETVVVTVSDHFAVTVAAAVAAEDFWSARCHRRAEYFDADVQVLVGDRWHTFEVLVRSEPTFHARVKKGVPPEWKDVSCEQCGDPFKAGTTAIICPRCEENIRLEREGEDGQ